MSRPLRPDNRAADHRVSWTGLVALVAYVALIFFVSSRPYLQAPGPDFDLKDKFVHAAEYAILGALLGRLLGRTVAGSFTVALLAVVAIGAGVGACDEVFQGTVPGRLRDAGDWVADVIGVAIGGAFALRSAPAEERQR